MISLLGYTIGRHEKKKQKGQGGTKHGKNAETSYLASWQAARKAPPLLVPPSCLKLQDEKRKEKKCQLVS